MSDWAGLMCQALSLATAQTVRPVVAVREWDTSADIGIFSGPSSHPRSYLVRPVPPAENQDFWLLIQRFVEWARTVDNAVASRVIDELGGVRSGAMGSIQTAALTLGVAVESLAGPLLGSVALIAEAPKELDQLLEHVQKWEGDASLRHRAVSVLGSLKRVRAVDRLRNFSHSRGIAAELVEAWKKLRDATTHGQAPKSDQTLYDRYYATTELLYRMLAFAIGYEGSICATATRGWRLDEWGFPDEGTAGEG
jgi:hypothetical protein